MTVSQMFPKPALNKAVLHCSKHMFDLNDFKMESSIIARIEVRYKGNGILLDKIERELVFSEQ